uniref:C2H2-type domain-containing protein n=1 Tax=Stomoxys calcitrans TaxID=35570 RepID=A0A1I8NYC3_STOCA
MATVIPPTSNVEAAYEDMFKEITRKLYGEETGNGLHTLGTPVAQVATTGPTAAPEGEQRSFTNLQIDRSTQPTIEYEHNTGNVVGSAAAGSATSAAASAAAVIAAATNQQNATNVVIQQQPEGSVVVTTTTSTGGNFKSEDHLSTAFGLAALMQQNGFATTTGTILSSQAINKVITTAAGSQQPQQQQLSGDQQQQQQQQAWNEGAQDQQQQQQQTQPAPTTQIVQWTTTPSGKLQSYSTTTAQPQQTQQQQQVSTPKSKNKNRNEHNSTPSSNAAEVIYTSPTATSGNNNMSQQQTPQNSANTSSSSTTSTSSSGGSSGGGSRKKSHHNQNNQNNNNGQPLVQKRYACTHCPYSTDRRDLYTRHENIHKDEKPFQCYACLKQFNRADHVKKHFLRMHREMQYDINKTRRHVPSSNSAGGGHHHGGGRSNVTITAVNTSPSDLHNDGNAIEQKPIIFQTQANVNLEQAFLEQQRQPTSSSLSIAETIEAVATATDVPLPQLKQEKNDDGTLVGGQVVASVKPKREKRFTCCYCPWSGADKWGLKRHLNTHTKPFVCLLCDYKAARSERLATHVLKVHNKRACNKCSFLGDSLEEFQQHLNEVHLLKMDAISRNTASVAQDFHKAGGVQELKLPANHQLLFNNKLPSQWTTKEAAALLQSLSNANNLSYVYQQQQRSKYAHHQNGLMRQRQHSLGDDSENTPSSDTSTTTLSDDLSPLKMERSNGHNHSHSHSLQMTPSGEQKKSGSSAAFLHKSYDLQDSGLSNSSSVIHATDNSSNSSGHHYHDDQENQEQLIRSSPAYKNNNNNNNYYNNNNNNNNSNYNNNLNKIKSSNRNTNSNNNNNNNHIQQQQQHQHRLDLHNKENNNNATFLTQMEFQNLNKIGTQFQNYVKDIISKYYAAETPVMFPNMPTPTATAQQSQQRLANQVSPKRKRLMSETEEYIEYLKNKEDITLTITPKLIANNQQQQQQQHHCKPQSPLKRERDLASDSYRRLSPKKTVITSTPHQQKANKKSLNQLATLLPLLADAASQQQYLTAPLDFSKKPTQQPIAEVKQEVVKEEFTGITIIKEEPQDPIESQTAEIAYANFAPPPPPAATTPPPLNCSLMYDKRSSRKQAQPKKMRQPPDVVVAALRDKYLNRMVDHKLSCADCVKMKRSSMLVFNYHTKASLCLHRLWKHAQKPMKCRICGDKFGKRCSYILHIIRRHNDMKGTEKLLSPQS